MGAGAGAAGGELGNHSAQKEQMAGGGRSSQGAKDGLRKRQERPLQAPARVYA